MSKRPPHDVAVWLKKFESSALYRHDAGRLFDDWLELVLCMLANQKQEERYLATAKRYTRDELNVMAELFAILIVIHEDKAPALGWYDALGEIYQHLAGRAKASRMGQFFTPMELCEVIARITLGDEPQGESMTDPACGSGRLLLAGHARHRKLRLITGADLDPMCAKMCAVNFWLHGIRGEVACMDSLELKWHHAYVTHPRALYPFVVFLGEDRKEDSITYVRREAIAAAVATPPVMDLFNQGEG